MDRSPGNTWTALLLRGALGLFLALVAQAVEAGKADRCPLSNTEDKQAWKRDCDAAIQAESDPTKKAELYFRRAYVANERQGYQQAVADLNSACALVPHQVKYLHERAYTLNSLGRYRDALADLNEEVRLQPQTAGAYEERALARTRLGDWSGVLADRDQVVKLGPPSMGALVARAHARLWLGQFEETRQDLKAAASVDSGAANTEDKEYFERISGLLESWTLHSPGENPAANCQFTEKTDFSRPTLIGDCTLAFLAAKTPREKAEALTTRSVAWNIARHSPHDMTNDCEAAVAVDPDNEDWHANLGFAYIQERHSWGARQEFDRSIEIHPTFLALAGRARAHYNLGETKLAFVDARKSFEIKPNEAALWVLGDLAKDRNDDASAKLYWMGAYHLGSRDDRLLDSLKSVGVKDPESEPR
jgi:tetratricopeptide (TPR) repeat protein